MTDNKIKIDFPEPTAKEIYQTQEAALKKFGVQLPEKDALRMVVIIKELDWYMSLPKQRPVSPEAAGKLAELFKKKYGKEISVSESQDMARRLMVLVPYKEKERLAKEMTTILAKHRKIDYSPLLIDKLRKLLELSYNISPNETDLKRILKTISRFIWQEEGMGQDVGECLDDMYKCADKQKRGKRVNGLNQHEKIRNYLEKIMNRLPE